MRNDPYQLSLFDAKGQAPAPPPAAIPPPPAEGREPLSLHVGDTFLKRVEGYQFGEASFWQSVADGAGDGFLQHDCYVLVRFHQDPDAKIYRRKVRAKDIKRDLDWAIEVTLFHEAQSFFYLLTGNATPRRLSDRDLRDRVPPATIRAVEKPAALVRVKGGPAPEELAYVEAAIKDALPAGYPSYAEEILSIRKTNGMRIVGMRLFDGAIGVLRLSGRPGAHGYGWDVGEVDQRPFHYDEAAGAWVRVNEPEA